MGGGPRGEASSHCLGRKMKQQKIFQIKFIMDLDGHLLTTTHNNQTTLDGHSGAELGEEARPGGSAGGV